MDAGSLELIRPGRRMDPRILFVGNTGRGQLQKPPRSSGPGYRRAFLALGKGYRKSAPRRARGGQIFFYILDPGRSFFYEPFFPALLPRSRGSHSRARKGPVRATVASLQRPSFYFLRSCAKGLPWITSGCDRERERACVTHALPFTGGRMHLCEKSSAVVLSSRVFLPISRGQRIARAHVRCPLLVLMTADKCEWEQKSLGKMH